MSKGVYLDEDECIGCASCVEICPEVFQMKEGEIRERSLNLKEGPKT